MKYIVENWFVIVGLIAVCAAGGYAVYVFVKMPSDKQLNKVRDGLIVYTELEKHCPALMGDMTDRNTEEFDKEENK